jgi:alpha-D-ribose 1-methylphosphonate 5-triphosphate synthase subunit PhnH
MQGQTLNGGFSEPVFGAQQTFRALMDALANPGQVQSLTAPLEAPPGLAPGLAAIVLTMCDHDTSVWLDTNLMESDAVLAWLRFHTASPVTTDPTRSVPTNIPTVRRRSRCTFPRSPTVPISRCAAPA